MRHFTLLTLVTVSATILVAAAPAAATEVTRASYREAVEPICQANTKANERILGGVRSEVKQGKLGPAAVSFAKAASELKKTARQLAAVPGPPADEAKLAKWLGKVRAEAVHFESIATKLRAGEKAAAQKLVVKLTTNANQANNIVLGFEFTYCRFEPSRFT